MVVIDGKYPVLNLNHTVTSNSNHGPTIQFTYEGYSTNRQVVIGTDGQGQRIDFGFSGGTSGGNSDKNPHNGISGYSGVTPMRVFPNGVLIGGTGTYPNEIASIAAGLTVQGNTKLNSTIISGLSSGSGASTTHIERIGGIRFGWDNATYGVQNNHSIRSTDGDSYGDHITLNSYGNVRINFDSNSNGTNYFRIGHATTGTGNVLVTIDETGNGTFAGNVTAYSDVRLKENIVDVDNALNKVCSMRGVYYNMIADTTKSRRLGLVAQEVAKVLPEVVIEAHPEDDKDSILSVDYGNITALLIEAIKELKSEVDDLKTQLSQKGK
tara:strand:+ start:12 stop:983 length:972 start_codon:yes stop_codon:yes gene_type:complete